MRSRRCRTSERRRILRGEYFSLGRQLAEFCLFPSYTRENVSIVVIYDGLENYEQAHSPAAKACCFSPAISARGSFPPSRIRCTAIRSRSSCARSTTLIIDRLVHRYRTLHGNRTVSKDDFVRGLLAAMRAGESVGILMDTNMTPPQGVFVDFFGVPACTASGLARIALRTDAAVVPGFTDLGREASANTSLRFDPALELVRTADDDRPTSSPTRRCLPA